MSKNQLKKSEQAGLHEKRLADLLKFLSNNETTIKSEGITYTSTRGDGYNHIKDALQQVTGMSEKAYYAYFEDMELGNKFSEMRKVYDTVGKVIHSIRPYLKSDGPIDSPLNRLVQEDAFTVDNNPIEFSDNPTTIGGIYGTYSRYMMQLTESFLQSPNKTLEPANFNEGHYSLFLKPFVTDLARVSDEQTLYDLQNAANVLNLAYENKWLTKTGRKRILYGYKNFGLPSGSIEKVITEDLTTKYLNLFAEKRIIRAGVIFMKYRYEFFNTIISEFNYDSRSGVGIKQLYLIIALEEEAKRRVLDDAASFLLEDTLFSISSSKDNYRSHHVHSDLTLDSLSELLAEYQFNNPASDFVESEYNLLKNPISVFPVYDVAKVGDSKAIIKKELTKTIKQLYLKKISKDLGVKDSFSALETLDPKAKNALLNALQGMKV